MKTALVMGTHIDFERGIKKHGSVSQMPQYPVMKKFSKEGDVTVFSIDKTDFTHKLPDRCSHYRIPNKLLFILLSWLIVGLVSRKKEVDYLYYFSASSIFALPFANKLSGAKSILFYGCMLWSSGKGFDGRITLRETVLRFFEERALGYVDYIIPSSKEINTFVGQSRFKGAILPIKKGVHFKRPSKKHKRDPKQIISVGWLEPIKDPLTLVTAFALHVKDPEAQLILCGDGSLYPNCRLFTIMDKRIKLLGQRDDIPDLLRQSGIFINSSLYEANSDAIAEAMNASLPIIATDVGGNPDYAVPGINGYLFMPRDEVALAKWINHLLENPFKQEMMGKSSKVMSEEYNLEKNLNKLVKILKGRLK